jgi:predicted amidophosphoribosyltransferase
MKNKSMSCLICEKELYSEIGEGCKMCGMPLEKINQEEFCCNDCKKKYEEINKNDK